MTTSTVEDPAALAALDSALRMARRGLRIFPICPNSKLPAHKGWQAEATTKEATIRKWFAHRTDRNYGIAMGDLLPNGRYSFALDVDMKRGSDGQLLKDGEASLRGLCEETGVDPSYLASTLTQLTPSGQRPDGKREGGHLIFSTSRPFTGGTDTLGPGLDTRGAGFYIVGHGSVIDGRLYEMPNPDAPILELPEAIEARLSVVPGKKADQTPLPGINSERAEERAVEFLKAAPGAKQGSRGSTAYKLAAKVKNIGCSEDQTLLLMGTHWAEKCEPPMPNEDLAESVSHAYRYSQESQGVDAPEAIFEPVPEPEEGECLHPFELMNKKFAFILANGSRPILHETQDEQGKPYTDFLSVQTFHEWHANVPFQSGDKIRSVSRWWMEWHGRRQYSRVGFIPEGDAPPGVFNLWRGFAVEARPGEWSKMRSHILEVICGGDAELNCYVLGWLALMFQKPGTRAGTALVLRGDKGTGKGTLGDWILRIFGRHGIHVSHARHLTGNFNAHLREAAFLFCDEAFFAGDKANESVLKSLITERELVIEAKGVDAIAQRNCLHVLMASNSDWVVPASANERRYCVIDVSDARMGDFEYFNALEKERDGGGLEAMLHDLLAQDLSTFNVWDIPRTQGLADQKLASLKGAERWLADAIAEESVYGYPWGSAELCVSQDEVYSAYEARARGRYHEWEPQTSKVFWKKLRRVAPTIRDTRPTEEGARVRKVVFPPLGTAREALSNFLGEGAKAPKMDIFL